MASIRRHRRTYLSNHSLSRARLRPRSSAQLCKATVISRPIGTTMNLTGTNIPASDVRMVLSRAREVKDGVLLKSLPSNATEKNSVTTAMSPPGDKSPEPASVKSNPIDGRAIFKRFASSNGPTGA